MTPYRVGDDRLFRRWDHPVFAVLTVAHLAAIVWAVRGWMASGALGQHTAIAAVLALPLVMGFAMYESRWLTLPLMRRPRHRPPAAGWRVGVATTFVPGAEPIEMLEQTVTALVAMSYPHETWVLDEGDSAEVRRLCARLGARHYSRKGQPEHLTARGRFAARTKHGNYNAWLDDVGDDRYDIVVNFDPDHIPVPEFLDRTLGYFDDPGVGYVQAAQVYYNQDATWIARGAAEETYAYYSAIQMSSYALGYPIVTGCHTANRVDALRQVGGFAPHEADDLLVTVYYRAAGWRGVYVPETLAEGIVPVDWPGYLTQQRRWARSVIDVKLRWFPKVAGKLRPIERMVGWLHGLYYLHGLGTALAVVMLCGLLATGTAPLVLSSTALAKIAAVALALQACELYRQRFFLNRRREWGVHWRGGLLRFAKWPTVLVALGDALRVGSLPYSTTMKVKGTTRRWALAPHVFAAAAVAVAWVIGTARGVLDDPVLQVAAGVFIAMSLGLAATELRDPPEFYDSDLAARRPTAERAPVAVAETVRAGSG